VTAMVSAIKNVVTAKAVAIYSNPKSFVNFLLPPQGIGEGWGGVKISDSCKDCYNRGNLILGALYINNS